MYKFIEEMTLNTWPSIHTIVHNGWLLRSSEGCTKRSNSVSPLYASSGRELKKQIAFCEEYYTGMGRDVIFKLTPFMDPVHLDTVLHERGYETVEPSRVQIRELAAAAAPRIAAKAEERLSDEWLHHMTLCGGLNPRNRDIIKRMLQDAALKQGFFTVYDGEKAVACGLGVIQGKWVGLYDIVTRLEDRNKGYGEQLVLNILAWAKRKGAAHSFLQVVQGNLPAEALYHKLGYREIYTYWYRIKKKAAD